jgi:hypothetical protein
MKRSILLFFMVASLMFISCKNRGVNNAVKFDFEYYNIINENLKLNDTILFISFVTNACECTRNKSIEMEKDINDILTTYSDYKKYFNYEKIEYFEKYKLVELYLKEFNIYFPPAVVIIKNNKLLFKAGNDLNILEFSDVLKRITEK